MLTDSNRGTGRTTRQILAAPANAIYIWPEHRSIADAKTLAASLGRSDIKFVTPDWLNEAYRGQSRINQPVIDHGTKLTDMQWIAYITTWPE